MCGEIKLVFQYADIKTVDVGIKARVSYLSCALIISDRPVYVSLYNLLLFKVSIECALSKLSLFAMKTNLIIVYPPTSICFKFISGSKTNGSRGSLVFIV